jgi:hypothetical protein
MTENSVIYIDRSEKSAIHIDWASLPTWLTEFSMQRPHDVLLCHAWFLNQFYSMQISLPEPKSLDLKLFHPLL